MSSLLPQNEEMESIPIEQEQVGESQIQELNVLTAESAEVNGLSRRLRTKFALGAAGVALAFQQSPGNEVTRGYLGLAALEQTGSPLMAGLAFGAATFAIESTTGTTAALAFRQYSEKVHSVKDKVLSKFKRLRTGDRQSKGTFISDSVLALSVGSAAVVARRHYHDKNRTARQDNITAVKAAGGISAASTALVWGGAELVKISEGTEFEQYVDGGVEVLSDWRTYGAALLVMGGVAVAKRIRGNEKKVDETILADIKNAQVIDHVGGRSLIRVDDMESAAAKAALEFEQVRWSEKGYGDLEEYNTRFVDQTILYAAFNGSMCVGSTRIFKSGSNMAPFIADMKYDELEQKDKIKEAFITGECVELGTAAVDKTEDYRDVALGLWRLAYRDAIESGVKGWGIIMEPRRVKAMSRMYGFNFRQMGQAIDYQGGDCAPHYMNFDDPMDRSRKNSLYEWFVDDPLNSSRD